MATSLKLLRLLSVLTILILSSWAFGTENFQVPVSNLKVYSGPSRSSPIVATLQKGQTVLAGANPAGGLKKVLITDPQGHKKIGYVFLADIGIRNPIVRAQGDNNNRQNSFSRNGGRRKRFGIGIAPGLNYTTESSRNITDANNNTYVASSLSGTNFQFGVDGTMGMSPTFTLEAYLEYKPSSLNANLSASNGTLTYPVTFTQTFIALGAIGRFYAHPYGSFWYGPGLEFDYGSNSQLTSQSNLFQTISVSNNLFFYLFAAVGYDFPIGRNFYATPEIKFGAIVNTSPVIIEADVLVNLGYKF
jgi:hypothetical protein